MFVRMSNHLILSKQMKNLIVSVFYVGLILGMSCKGKSPVSPLSCGTNAQKVTDAAVAYSQNPGKAACEAYKKEVIAFIKSCPTFYTGTTKQDLEDFANEPCD